jgi:hypothetical protein
MHLYKEDYVMRRDARTLRRSASRSTDSPKDDELYLTDGPPGIDMLKKCSDPGSAPRVDVVTETHNFVNETHMAMEVQWVGDNGKVFIMLDE